MKTKKTKLVMIVWALVAFTIFFSTFFANLLSQKLTSHADSVEPQYYYEVLQSNFKNDFGGAFSRHVSYPNTYVFKFTGNIALYNSLPALYQNLTFEYGQNEYLSFERTNSINFSNESMINKVNFSINATLITVTFRLSSTFLDGLTNKIYQPFGVANSNLFNVSFSKNVLNKIVTFAIPLDMTNSVLYNKYQFADENGKTFYTEYVIPNDIERMQDCFLSAHLAMTIPIGNVLLYWRDPEGNIFDLSPNFYDVSDLPFSTTFLAVFQVVFETPEPPPPTPINSLVWPSNWTYYETNASRSLINPTIISEHDYLDIDLNWPYLTFPNDSNGYGFYISNFFDNLPATLIPLFETNTNVIFETHYWGAKSNPLSFSNLFSYVIGFMNYYDGFMLGINPRLQIKLSTSYADLSPAQNSDIDLWLSNLDVLLFTYPSTYIFDIITANTNNDGYYLGYDLGFEQGYLTGYQTGYYDGIGATQEQIYDAGYLAGLADSQNNQTNYNNGYNAGYLAGLSDDANNLANYQSGYHTGYNDGIDYERVNGNDDWAFSWLTSLVGGLDSLLQIQIFPNFPLALFLGIPFLFGLLMLIYRLLIGG